MTPERDTPLPAVQPARRVAVVRGLRPRLWSKRFLARGLPIDAANPDDPQDPTAPLTYDDRARLHGGPGTGPHVDLED
jgi:hypothetical protein